MKEKFNDATFQRPEGNRVIDAPLVGIDLTIFINEIKQEITWQQSDRNAITVFKTNGLRIVLVALHKDAVMARHIADGIISVEVLAGSIQFDTDEKSIVLNKGQMIALHEGIPHSVFAVQEAIFLLTLTTTVREANH